MKRKAIIIGAGPAGLTAAYELLKRTDITPIILEKSGDIGGISKTVNYKGNRIDLGGHRFFSKSDRVMNWWLNIMPVQPQDDSYFTITYQRKHKTIKQQETHPRDNDAAKDDKVMLVRKRLSRIYFLRKFFTYPIQLSIDTLRKLGLVRTIGILFSYLKAQLFPRKPEKSLEDFLINRFGVKLYQLFFKDYTEKVWGVPCQEISAEWGAQRIKGVSISKAIQHAVKEIVKKKNGNSDISQKDTETSLIEQFLYPKYGPGQLWEEVARQVIEMGGEIVHYQDVKEVITEDNHVTSIVALHSLTGKATVYEGEYFFSTMPVQELINGMNGNVPPDVQHIASGLQYRDFITVGVLLKKLTPPESRAGDGKNILPDTWIYIQEKDVKVGRLQIFNNWSPFMVKDPDTVWIGMEYFCNSTDAFWNLPDDEIQKIGISELEKMGLANVEDVLDSTVLRMEKTYPAYFGTYDQFGVVRAYVDSFENLFLVGRNGMHKYNNSDHSMLTAMVGVDNIAAGVVSKENIWAINTEQEYHEEKRDRRDVMKNNSTLRGIITGDRLPTYAFAEGDDASSKQKIRNTELDLSLSFRDYVFRNKRNRTYLWLVLTASVVQFAIFKYCYPFASFINGDSYIYLETAYNNLSINTYPVGYSNFLRLFSVFTKSDTVLVGFQYITLTISILAFLFTMFFFCRPGKIVQIFLLAFVTLNPVFLYLSNYVSSDAVFLTLSITWFTLLLWTLYKPSLKLIIWHGFIIFFAFTVRYNAMYYPVIAGLAILLSKHTLQMKITGSLFGILLIALFIYQTGNKYIELTGSRQFSPFSGWQIANNAMYAYRYVPKENRKKLDAKYSALDNMIRAYFDSTRNLEKFPIEKLQANTVYMWSPQLPLRKYMESTFKNDTSIDKLKQWAIMGPLYSKYGYTLIKLYPLFFLKYYIWPNLMKFYAPPIEFLDQYNMGINSVDRIAQKWFEYKSSKVTCRLKNFNVNILNFWPLLIGCINLLYPFGLIAYYFLQGHTRALPLYRGLLSLSITLWSTNLLFSVFASPVALRFQLFTAIISITSISLIMEYIIRVSLESKVINIQDANKLVSYIPKM